MKKINILLTDDEALLREGLNALLVKEDFVNAIYEAGNAAECKENLAAHRIDVVLMDIRLPGMNGMELIAYMRAQEHPAKIVALTGLEGVELVVGLLKAGVHGIVHKLDGYQAILKTLRGVVQEDTYFPERVLKIIQANAHRWDAMPPVLLTFQEKELLKAIADGLTTKQTAVHLKMSEATAETYRVRLIKKVGTPNTAALLAYAFRNGLL
jgi:DNA-binding NarL/FixJ family response regulator